MSVKRIYDLATEWYNDNKDWDGRWIRWLVKVREDDEVYYRFVESEDLNWANISVGFIISRAKDRGVDYELTVYDMYEMGKAGCKEGDPLEPYIVEDAYDGS